MISRSGFAFIVSHLEIDGDLPVEVYPGYVFRAASDFEISIIKSYINQTVPRDTFRWVPYESYVRKEQQENGYALHYENLGRDKWKYWVIVSEAINDRIFHGIELVGHMLPAAFDIGFVLFYDLPDMQGDVTGLRPMPIHIIERYSSFEQAYSNAEVLRRDQIEGLKDLYQLLISLPSDYNFISKALNNFSNLQRIPDSSELKIVGYFSIIESLITHPPRLTESLDSINHQIKNKLILLRKKYSRQISLNQYFQVAPEKTIWGKLYSYRSDVAHGGDVSFETKYQILKSRESVITFLRDNIKELLLLAFRDPVFISDFREC